MRIRPKKIAPSFYYFLICGEQLPLYSLYEIVIITNFLVKKVRNDKLSLIMIYNKHSIVEVSCIFQCPYSSCCGYSCRRKKECYILCLVIYYTFHSLLNSFFCETLLEFFVWMCFDIAHYNPSQKKGLFNGSSEWSKVLPGPFCYLNQGKGSPNYTQLRRTIRNSSSSCEEP